MMYTSGNIFGGDASATAYNSMSYNIPYPERDILEAFQRYYGLHGAHRISYNASAMDYEIFYGYGNIKKYYVSESMMRHYMDMYYRDRNQGIGYYAQSLDYALPEKSAEELKREKQDKNIKRLAAYRKRKTS